MRFTYELFDADSTRKNIHIRLRYDDFIAHVRRGGVIKVTDNLKQKSSSIDVAANVDYVITSKVTLDDFVLLFPEELKGWPPNDQSQLTPIKTQTAIDLDDVKWLCGVNVGDDQARAMRLIKCIMERI
jgi:hypothetical protein